MPIVEEIRDGLAALRDEDYRRLQLKTIPTLSPDTVIGVRTPALRRMAVELRKRPETAEFLGDLPHRSFEENQLHAFLISEIRDSARCLEEVSRFLPWVDNWATCDQMTPKAFRSRPPELLENIRVWLGSQHTYTVRFGIKMLMDHYLGEAFSTAYPAWVAAIRSEEYYVNMMIAWYFATALAVRYEEVLPLLRERRLAPWTHNKAIQKAVESFRVTPAHKEELRRLRIGREERMR